MARNKGNFRFRVSDAVPVPLRGMMLRLKLVEGSPRLEALEPGEAIRLVAPDGQSRVARVKAFTTTEGRPTQERLDEQRQLDLLIDAAAARQDGRSVGIGWHVVGE